MKLYDSRLAPNPRRVRWFMAEKGITNIEIDSFDLFTNRQKSPEYLAEVSAPQCPALILDDGEAITESVAICRYLESLYPKPNLFGIGALETARIEMWMRRVEMTAATPLMMAVRHGHPALAALETQQPVIAETSRSQAQHALVQFEARLGLSEWLAADRVTIADGILFVGLEFARMVRFKIGDDTPNLLRWQGAMRARPSAVAGT